MIRGMITKNVNCVLDENSIIDTSDGFYSHHFEQWDLVSRETKKYVGFVTFEECIPEVTRNGEKYDMLITVAPFDNERVQGFEHLKQPCGRIKVLKKAIELIEFVQNN